MVCAFDPAEQNRKEIQACAYAALMIHAEGDLEISEDKLRKVVKAGGNEVTDLMLSMFAKALKGQDIGAML